MRSWGQAPVAATRESFRKKLRAGELDDKDVEIALADTASPLQGYRNSRSTRAPL